jgi:hypothetical protein
MDRGAYGGDSVGSDSYAFRVSGIEPTDNTFRDAGEETHRAYWRYIVDTVLELKDKSLAKGLDRFGKPMIPIAASTRAKGLARSYTGLGDPDAPPLTPAYGISRTRALFRGRAFADHAEFFWAFDEVTKRHWGVVLGYHRAGGPHLPVRDVIGLAPADLAEARHRGQLWWYHYQEGARLEVATAKLGLKQPLTGRVPPPKFVVTGDTDLDQYTFGIAANKERTARAIAEGYHSGFSRKIGGMPTITTMPTKPKPPAPAPARTSITREELREATGAALHERRAEVNRNIDRLEAERNELQAKPRRKPAETARLRATTQEINQNRAERISLNDEQLKQSAAQKARLQALLEERRSAAQTTGAFHGMTNPETFHSIEFEGIRYHFTGHSQVADTLTALARSEPLPASLTTHTKDVYFTGQRNKDDPYWEKEYQMPGFQSGATGGNGLVVAYNGTYIGPSTLSHEMGHNLASAVFGHTNPALAEGSKAEAYLSAMRSGEQPVSFYATRSPAEDFAESVKMFVAERAKMEREYPRRFAAVKALLE